MSNRKSGTNGKIIYIVLAVLLAAAGLFFSIRFGTQKIETASGVAYTQSATKFDNIETKYAPDIKPDGDHIKQRFKVINKGMSAIEVRVKYPNDTKVLGDLTFELKNDTDSVIKSYTFNASQIDNWHYIKIPLDGVSLEKGKEYSLEIYLAGGQDTDVYDLYLSGTSVEENIQLYCNDTVIDGQLDIVYTYVSTQFVLGWPGALAVFLIIALVWLLLLAYKTSGSEEYVISRKTKVFKCVVYILVLAIMLTATLLGMFKVNSESKVTESGTRYEQSADNFMDDDTAFTSYMWPDDNHIRQNFIPEVDGLVSIAVRVENEKPGEMTGDLIFEIRDDTDTVIYTQTVPASQIEDWDYVQISTEDCSFSKGKTYSIEIYVAADKETHPYRLYLSGQPIAENGQLYSYGFEMEGQLDIIYGYRETYNTFAGMNWSWSELTAVLSIFMVLMVFVLDLKGVQAIRTKHIWPVIPIEIAFFTGLVAMVECLSQGDITQFSLAAIVLNACICGWLYLLFMLIFNSRRISVFITVVLLFALGTINFYTLRSRGTVLLPSDIYSIGTAMEVVKNYNLMPDEEIFGGIRWACTLCAVCIWLFKGKSKGSRIISIVFLALIGFGCGKVFTDNQLQYKLDTKVDMSAQTSMSHKYGFLLNAGENIKYAFLRKPEGYSKETAASLVEGAETVTSDAAQEADNIIVIMNESFADLRLLGDIETNKPFLESFDALKSDPNCKTGKVVVDVFGGGTSCSEFEFLTGCTMSFLSAGNAPYQQYIHKDTASLASYLKNLGDDTVALHPANPLSWSRNTAYPKLGFDRFLNSTSEEFANAERCRWWIGDEALMQELYNQIKLDDNDLFEFGLTIQCHGGYDNSNFSNTIQVLNYNDEEGKVSQYLTLLSMSDNSFGNMISELRESDEKTIVVMFGDHLPALPEDFYNGLIQSDGDYRSDLRTYETPYIVWANYDIDTTEIPDVLSVNFLAPYVLKTAGKDLTGYFSYLYKLSKQYPIVSKWGIYDNAMNQFEYTTDSSCYEAIHNYEMAQYYILK